MGRPFNRSDGQQSVDPLNAPDRGLLRRRPFDTADDGVGTRGMQGANPRWSRQGLWLEIFETLTGQSSIHGLAMIDSTHIKAHRSAGGAKRGAYFQALGQLRGGKTSKLHF